MDLLPVYDFVASWTGGLENVGNVGLLNFLTLSLILLEKSMYWKAVKSVVRTISFLKILIFLENLNFVIGNKFCQLFSLK